MSTTNTTHQSAVRRALRLSALLLGLALPASADTVVPATWYSARDAGVPAVGGGIRFVTNTTGFQNILAYFDPVSLQSIGAVLSVSLTFSGEFGANSPEAQYPVGFAFYNSDGNRISANRLGQNGGSPPAYKSYRGYRVDLNTAARPSQSPMRLVARSVDNIALASPSAHVTIFGGGNSSGARTMESGVRYTVTYTFTRTATGALDVGFSITGDPLGKGYAGAWTVTPTSKGFTTAFDTFAITLAGPTTFDSLTLHDVAITTPSS